LSKVPCSFSSYSSICLPCEHFYAAAAADDDGGLNMHMFAFNFGSYPRREKCAYADGFQSSMLPGAK
jgi:hypothetical protein